MGFFGTGQGHVLQVLAEGHPFMKAPAGNKESKCLPTEVRRQRTDGFVVF